MGGPATSGQPGAPPGSAARAPVSSRARRAIVPAGKRTDCAGPSGRPAWEGRPAWTNPSRGKEAPGSICPPRSPAPPTVKRRKSNVAISIGPTSPLRGAPGRSALAGPGPSSRSFRARLETARAGCSPPGMRQAARPTVQPGSQAPWRRSPGRGKVSAFPAAPATRRAGARSAGSLANIGAGMAGGRDCKPCAGAGSRQAPGAHGTCAATPLTGMPARPARPPSPALAIFGPLRECRGVPLTARTSLLLQGSGPGHSHRRYR